MLTSSHAAFQKAAAVDTIEVQPAALRWGMVKRNLVINEPTCFK
jgi:hypothetical protein